MQFKIMVFFLKLISLISYIYILTSTKNTSLIITNFSAKIYKNEQLRTDFYVDVGRFWKITSYSLNVHMASLYINRY